MGTCTVSFILVFYQASVLSLYMYIELVRSLPGSHGPLHGRCVNAIYPDFEFAFIGRSGTHVNREPSSADNETSISHSKIKAIAAGFT